MESACIEVKSMNKHTREGLRILARIIARDCMAKQSLNGDDKEGDADNEHIQGR